MGSKNYREIRLNDRDRSLLAFIEEQGFASFSQLNKMFFKTKGFCSERLDKLCFFGYLDKKKLIDFFKNPNTKETSQGYWPHLNNLNVSPIQKVYFINRKYSKGYGKSQSLFKPSMVLHQLILNDVRGFIEDEIKHKWVHNDPYLKILSSVEFGRSGEIIPDLSVECDNLKFAVEVERTPKGRARYFKRVNYFRDSVYTHVVYYYTDECQLKPLLDRVGLDKKFSFAHYTTPNKLINPVFGTMSLLDFVHS